MFFFLLVVTFIHPVSFAGYEFGNQERQLHVILFVSYKYRSFGYHMRINKPCNTYGGVH